MAIAYRVAWKKYADSIFSGVGSIHASGRWHTQGIPMVYASQALALAILEWRVHVNLWPPPPVVYAEVEFDDALLEAPKPLPADWNSIPFTSTTQAIGDAWWKSQRSLGLIVPSVLSPKENNVLLNIAHPGWRTARQRGPFDLRVDSRLGHLT